MGKTISEVELRVILKQWGYNLNSCTRDEKSKLYVNITCENGHTFEARYDTLLKTKECKYCKGVSLSYEYVKQYIESFGQKLLDTQYKTARTKLTIMCEHGHVYHPTFDSFKSKGSRCPECKGVAKRDYKYVKQYMEGFGYKLMSHEYTSGKEHIEIMCDKGHIYTGTFTNFKNHGKRCPHCNGGISLTYDYVKEYIESFGYSLLDDEYKNARTPLLIKCDKGHIFDTTFDCFKNKNIRCSVCSSSKGETRLYEALGNFNISYIPQYRFQDCRYRHTLPFDVYIPALNTAIEYDGIQHFEPIDFSGKMTQEELLNEFNLVKTRDRIKDTYCKENNIKLIRVAYWEYNDIEEILARHLELNCA